MSIVSANTHEAYAKAGFPAHTLVARLVQKQLSAMNLNGLGTKPGGKRIRYGKVNANGGVK